MFTTSPTLELRETPRKRSQRPRAIEPALADRPPQETEVAPLLLGMLVSLGGMLAYFALVGQPIWGTNDDVAMSLRAAGILLADQPTPDVMFMHPLYGWFLSRLYLLQQDVPWYAISFLLIVGLSAGAVNYAVLRLHRTPGFFLLLIGATAAKVLVALRHLQFTIVGGLAALSGVLLLVSLHQRQPVSQRSLRMGTAAAIALVSLGFMIRWNSMAMVVLLTAPCAAVPLLANSDRNKQHGFRRGHFVMAVAIAGACVLCLTVVEQRHYDGVPEWKRWKTLNRVKAEFLDYGRIEFNARTRSAFEFVGWTGTDDKMIRAWLYADPQRYAPEKFVRLVARLKDEKRIPVVRPWRLAAVICAEGVETVWTIAGSLLACVVVAGALAVRWKWQNLLYLLLSAAAVGITLIYLYMVLNRDPFRVLAIFWASVLWSLLLMAATSLGPPVLAGRGGKALSAIVGACLLLLLGRDACAARQEVVQRVEDHRALQQLVSAWHEDLPDDAIVCGVGASFPFEHQLPLASAGYLRALDGFVNLGCLNQSPHQRETLRRLGLADDFFGALAARRHAYLVNRRPGTWSRHCGRTTQTDTSLNCC